jgi:hypothetical protein
LKESAEVWFLYGSASHGFSVQLVSYTLPQKDVLGEATVLFEGSATNDTQGTRAYLTDLAQKYKGLLRIEIRIPHKQKTLALTTERAMEILPDSQNSSVSDGVSVRFQSLVDLATTSETLKKEDLKKEDLKKDLKKEMS